MKHLYRIPLLTLLLALCLSCLWGCGEKLPQQDETPQDTSQQQQQQQTDQAVILSDTIVCSDGDTTLRFVRLDEEHWGWKDDADFPLDNSYVTQLLQSVEAMLVAQPITTDKTLEDLGLDDEEKYVTVSDEKGQAVTWYLGKKDDNGRYYMCLAGDESGAVYLSPADLSAQISRSIYDMMVLPQLPAMNADSILRITITAGETTMELTPTGNGHWSNGTAIVDAKMEPLLAALAQPELRSCMDFKPSAGAAAICGLDPAAAVMTVEYLNIVAVESTFVLSVGEMRGDDYCVCINDDTTIYRMSAETVAPVLAFVS